MKMTSGRKFAVRLTAGALLAGMLMTAPAAGTRAYAADNGPVKTIQWKATLKQNIKVKVNDKKIKLRKGKAVVVTVRRFSGRSGGNSSTVKIGGGSVKIPNRYLSYVSDLCTVTKTGDYTEDVKTDWVNEKNFSSKTKWLVWICLDKQRVNVFRRDSDGDWELQRACRCSTGKATTPTTPSFSDTIGFKKRWFKYYKNSGNLAYFMEFAGNGMHVWVGGNRGSLLGKHTASHGCTRMTEEDAIWMFERVPTRTKVIVW